MDRLEKMRTYVDRNGLGLEIGPSHNPIASKKDGYRVHILDCADREALREKFRPHNVNIDNIEDVDFLWSGQPFRELTGGDHTYDWIIASHVVEHTPDLIAFFNECDSILKHDGVLTLAVPDKRFCFDYFRQVSGLGKVVDFHLDQRKRHSPGAILEFNIDFTTRNEQHSWSESWSYAGYKLSNTLEGAKNAMSHSQMTSEYIDAHNWVFTPHSFRLIVEDLFALGFIQLRELAFLPTSGCEFYIYLSRQGSGPGMSRMEMLKGIQSDLSSVAAPPARASEPTPLRQHFDAWAQGAKERTKRSLRVLRSGLDRIRTLR